MACLYPVSMITPDGRNAQRPCGQCTRCLVRKKLCWSGRLIAEGTQWESASFLTLTYEDSPIDLIYSHVQNFLKQVRKHKTVRFYAVGEYGERGGRPHWHLILFGMHPPYIGMCELQGWSHGLAYFGDLTPASAAYVAGYNLKGIGDPRKSFARMSRKPGIGHHYFERAGQHAAKRGLPPVIDHVSYGQHRFPIDKYCRDTFTRAYVASGGQAPPDYDPNQWLAHQSYLQRMKGGSLDTDIKKLTHDYKMRMQSNGSQKNRKISQISLTDALYPRERSSWSKPTPTPHSPR